VAVVEMAAELAVDVALGGEATDLGGKAGGEPGGVEAIDGADAALPGEEAGVVRVHVVPEHGYQAHPRDHHPLPRICLPPRGRR
jgi:hypothetical protein